MKSALMLLLVLPAAGCTIAGGGLEDMVDHTIQTASIGQPAAFPASDPEQMSDGNTVRNAVSAANLAGSLQPVAWANADTGTSGVISTISETRAGTAICRSFTTSRQRFDGIALYDGEACTTGRGEWTLTRFARNG